MSDRRETEIPVKVVDRRWWAQHDEAAPGEGTPEGEWRPGKPTYVEQLEAQLAEKDRQLQELIGRHRDAVREFEDGRARLRKDIAREIERGRRSLLAELLDVMDNLDRAIEAGRTATSAATLVEGVELVRRMFLTRLDGFGVTRIEPLGERFDPVRHEALTLVPAAEASQDDIVCGVLAPGYLVGDEVLRPARVAVGRHTPE